ncbi:MAG: sppA [Phycisphaerales bacterium]|nr:sppA [Phycisphaerales bacterium]
MIPQPPPGQGPIDPRDAFSPPTPLGGPGAGPGVPWQPLGPGVVMQSVGPQGGGAPGPQGPGQFGSQGPGPTGQAPSGPPGYPPPGYFQGGYPPGGMPPGYPPQMRPPGPFMPPYPPARRRLGWGWGTLLVLLFILLGGSMLLNLVVLAGGGAGGVQSTIAQGDVHQQIAVIPLEGLIDESLANKFDRFLTRAQNDKNVKAVVILIDTPGGSVTASDEAYKRIKKFKGEKNVPVVVAMRSLATSGGYYAACGADHIVAERTTLTGNIGVLLPRFNLTKLMDKLGVEEDTIVSTGAIYKNAGSMFKPDNERDIAYFQTIADSAFTQFKLVVSNGRKGKLKGTIDEIANGKAYTAQEALDNGLIDDIDDTGYLDAAIKYATSKAGLTGPMVVKYQDPPVTLFDLMAGSQSRFGRAPSANGININLDASLLDRVSSPRLMYLYRVPQSKE